MLYEHERTEIEKRRRWAEFAPEERAIRLLLAEVVHGKKCAEICAIARAELPLHVSVLQTGQRYGYALALDSVVPSAYLLVSCFLDNVTDVDVIDEGRSRCLTARGPKLTRARRRIMRIVVAYLNRHITSPREPLSAL